MINRDVFARDPARIELLNNGVAQVNDARTDAELRTLRYELRTFVCEGQYELGLRKILEVYLGNLSRPEQPGVWVSGFFGSGKSHFVKMARALWTDQPFPEHGDTPRGLVELPSDIRDLLTELSAAGRRAGGLHAAAGTLGAGASSVRLALLSIVFRSVGLPEQYDRAQFVMWLRSMGVENQVRADLESNGLSWDESVARFALDPRVAAVVARHVPELGSSPDAILNLLDDRFPVYKPGQEIESGLMLESIQRAIAPSGRFPCTLIALDEVQQYISEKADRAYAVQEVVEACSKKFAGQLLFVGTGQTALTHTAQLLKLKGRFPIEVELSDTDVDTVVRRIVLQKKPSSVPALEAMLVRHRGEVSRHLAGSRLEANRDDEPNLVDDYPLLPVRRRLWERLLRAVDSGGTVGQLRNQLKAVYDAVQQSADATLGTVVGADFLYFNLAPTLLQTGVLPREIDNIVRPLSQSDVPDDRLRARIIAMVFLIGKLPRERGSDDGVRATPDVLADLLVEDLAAGSAELRRRIPELCAALVEQGKLMQVDAEYRVQTRESSAWQSDFDTAWRSWNDLRFASARDELVQRTVLAALKPVSVVQGQSKVKRELRPHFGADWPKEPEGVIPAWIRSRFNDDERDVLADARKAGLEAPTLFVFLPNPSPDELKKALITAKAAEETLAKRGTPTTPEGVEARGAVETRQANANRRLASIMEEMIAGAVVYQAGGAEIVGASLQDKIRQGASNALVRIFPRFELADNPRWAAVITSAKQGSASALEQVGHVGDPEKHPVCTEVLRRSISGVKGADLRRLLEAPPYGWSRDAIDGAIYVLILTDHMRASQGGAPTNVAALDRARIGTTDLRAETVVVTASERMAVRKLMVDAGISCRSGEEATRLPALLVELRARANRAGGEPPAPARPDLSRVEALERLTGNALVRAAFEGREALDADARAWQQRGEVIARRAPRWLRLEELHRIGADLPEAAAVGAEMAAMREQRRLLADPDPVPLLCEQMAEALRAALLGVRAEQDRQWKSEMSLLESTDAWTQMNAVQRATLLRNHNLERPAELRVGTEDELLSALRASGLGERRHMRDASSQRFAALRLEAARMVEPDAKELRLRRATLRTPEEAEVWLTEAREKILDQLKAGPVIV